jgi:two-component system chemotaxis sensor kinase CheA
MDTNEDLMVRLREIFKTEASEHLDNAGQRLVDLEKVGSQDGPGEELLAEIFRAIHSLKGSARMVGADVIARVSHQIESLLEQARAGRIGLTPSHFDLMLRSLDVLERLVDGVGSGEDSRPDTELDLVTERLDRALNEASGRVVDDFPYHTGEPTNSLEDNQRDGGDKDGAASFHENGDNDRGESPEISASKLGADRTSSNETIRVPAKKLDDLLAQTGELLGAKISIDQRAKDVRALAELGDSLVRGWKEVRQEIARLALDDHASNRGRVTAFLDENQEKAAELSSLAGTVATYLTRDRARVALATTDLQEGVRRMRMLSISSLLDTYPRMVRDLARRQGKEVQFQVLGSAIEVDKRVLEGLKDPLTHLLRNAVDHGLEDPVTRKANGKKPLGTLTVTASAHGNHVVIEVSDDGAGIDVEHIKATALTSGLVTETDVAGFQPGHVLDLLFRPGFSTSSVVTDVSGRGVGLDVVRANVEALEGRVEVETALGRGTTFRMILPLTLATAQALLVSAGGETLALPITSIDRILNIGRSDIRTLEGGEVIVVDGRAVPLARLADLLELTGGGFGDRGAALSVVVLGSADKRVGLLVEVLLEQQEVVVKDLGPQLARVRNVSGATILGSGQVVVVLNPSDLIASAMGGRARRSQRVGDGDDIGRTTKTVLVVDDSITTRTFQRATLEAAGYEVTAASDGQEAWRLLQTGDFDLVITDVNMPRVTGLQLTKLIKENNRMQDLPVILLSSMGSREDKEKGMEAGADAYVVKSAFDRDSMLATVRQLI